MDNCISHVFSDYFMDFIKRLGLLIQSYLCIYVDDDQSHA